MGECAGDIIENCLIITRRKNSEDDRALYWRKLNTIYFRICAKYSWNKLRRTTTLDFATMTDETGMWLPSNLLGIDAVIDYDDQFEYFDRDRADIDEDERKYRYYTYIPSETDGFFGQDGNVAKDGTALTSTELVDDGTDYTGYYVKFGSELGYYLMDTSASFTPAYRGEELQLEDFRIRPKETMKLVTIDPTEEVMDDNKVYIHYWQAPQPLYRDSDEICIPSGKVLELLLLRELPEAKAYRPVSESEIDKAMQECLSMNPCTNYTKPKRNAVGGWFKFSGNNYYTERK